MKINWSLILGSIVFVAAVFAVAVLDGFNSVDPPHQATLSEQNL